MFKYQILFHQRNLQKPVDENVLPIEEDDDEEAENDMLAACINIGMQNNRYVLFSTILL